MIVVIGGGPAGIAAAARAAESGQAVTLLDESPRAGGQIWRHRTRTSLPAVAQRWLARLDRSGAVVRAGTSAIGVQRDDDAFIVTAERDGVHEALRATHVILATGARERFLPFPGWTLPGVIGVGGAQALLKAGASFAGKRVVIAGSGPLLLPVAASLSRSGAKVLLVAEQAASASVMRFGAGLVLHPATLFQAARYRASFARTPYHFGRWPVAARGTGRVEQVDITNGRATEAIACDVLCAAFGLVPNTELARLLGCAVDDGGVSVDAHQETTVPGIYTAGETTGIGGMELAVIEGEIAGLHASDRAGDAQRLESRRDALQRTAAAMERAFAPRAELRRIATADTIVCRCEDVKAGAIDPTWSSRQAKLYTRAGMGPCQGRVCGAALEFLHGWPADVVRLPAEPANFSTLAASAATTAAPADQGV